MDDLFSTLMQPFEPFEDMPHVAVAVSGGVDSMALALLTQEWVHARRGKVTALIVDHGLRPESGQEALQVLAWLGDLGISTELLRWEGPKPTTRIQERARCARYGLLEGWCLAHGVRHLLTGHHEGDQWETIMQRLTRGSGIQGLRGIQAETKRPFGRLLRPLLEVKKSDLIAYLAQREQSYIQDPSNDNSKFERVRWRQQRGHFEKKGYTSDKIAHISREACKQFDELEMFMEAWIVKHLEVSEYGYLSVDWDQWSPLTREQQHYLIKRILRMMAPSDKLTSYPIPSKILDQVCNRLNGGHGSVKKAVTLGGCYMVKRGDKLLIVRETRPLKTVLITGRSCRWDRFIIDFKDDRFDGLTIEPLGMRRAIHCMNGGFLKGPLRELPSYILASLPCIVMKEEIFLLPCLPEEVGDFSLDFFS